MTAACFAPTMVGKRLINTAKLALRVDCRPAPFKSAGAKIRAKGNVMAGGLPRGAPAQFIGRSLDGIEVSVRRKQTLTPSGRGDYHSMHLPDVTLIVSEDVFWEVFDMASISVTASWLSRD